MKWPEFKERTKTALLGVVIRTADYFYLHRLLARLCVYYVREVQDGIESKFVSGKTDEAKVTVLVLDALRFRGDVDILSKAPDLHVLSVSWGLLRYLMAAYIYLPTNAEVAATKLNMREEFAKAGPESAIFSQREKSRNFLHKFLPHFLALLNVDVLLNSDNRYRRETDFTRIGVELGYKHICFYREGLFIVPAIYQLGLERNQALRPFYGNLISVQNEVTRQMMIEAKLTDPDKIIVSGCMRMDDFLKKIKKNQGRSRQKDKSSYRVTFFSCPKSIELNNHSYDLFANSLAVVKTLAELARMRSDIHVTIKMKDQHAKPSNSGSQLTSFEDVLYQVFDGVWPENIEINTEKMSAHELILRSDVIIAMQSTTVLEAAVAEKVVILPHFLSLRQQPNANQALLYSENYELFDVPEDEKDLLRMVLLRLDNFRISPSIMTARQKLFDQYISPSDASATENSISLIHNLVDKSQNISS